MADFINFISENQLTFALAGILTILLIVLKIKDRTKPAMAQKTSTVNIAKELIRKEAMDEITAYLTKNFGDITLSHEDFSKAITEMRRFWLPVIDRIDKKE